MRSMLRHSGERITESLGEVYQGLHPEADGEGMLRYMLTTERKQQVITAYGEEKYDEMVRLLADSSTIEHTESIILPTFLRRALAHLVAAPVLA